MQVETTRRGSMPGLGFGTWQLNGTACYEGVRHALEIGYRHLDTAQMYGNEEHVGRALHDTDVDREDVFLTTKLARSNLSPEAVRRTGEQSLRALGVDHVDLLLIHWPNESVPLADTLGAMGELRDEGKVRHLGVSNFTTRLLGEAVEHAEILTDQIEYHPYLDQDALRAAAIEHDVLLTAYSPLAKGKAAGDETLKEIGDRHGKSPAQVALRWLIQQDHVVAIPRSSSASHRESNFDIFDFELGEHEMDTVFSLGGGHRVIDPGFAPDWD